MILDDDDVKMGARRVRAYQQENPTRPILWVKDDAELAAAYFGVTEIVDLEDIEPLKIEREKRGPRFAKGDLRCFSRERWAQPDVDLDAGGIYILSDAAHYEFRGEKGIKYDDLRKQFYSPALKLELLNKPVYVLLATQRDIPTKHRGWVSLEKVIEDGIKGFDPKAYASFLGLHQLIANDTYRMLNAVRPQLPKKLQNFMVSIDAMRVQFDGVHQSRLAELWARFNKQPAIAADLTLNDRFAKLVEPYPLLSKIQDIYDATKRAELLSHYLKLITRK